jgi:MSHA biogenesis protein MshK
MVGCVKHANSKCNGGKLPSQDGWPTRICLFIFVIIGQAVYAENLPDPTRPPSESEMADVSAGVQTGPVLQSVLISEGRKAAIISGETVLLGGIYGSARLVRISEGEVVLNRGGNLQTLKLFPAVNKKAAHTASSGTDNNISRTLESGTGEEK